MPESRENLAKPWGYGAVRCLRPKPKTSKGFRIERRRQHEQKRSALVMFHVSWCKACQRTFPTFAAASNSALGRGSLGSQGGLSDGNGGS